VKSDLGDLPEKVIRDGDCSYFLYPDRDVLGSVKCTAYHKYTKVLNISIDHLSRTVTCLSTNLVTYHDLYHIEKILKGVLPTEVSLLELLSKAIISREGSVTINF